MSSSVILITGAAGFIGSHVSRNLLANGHSVLGLDNFNDYYSQVTKKWNVARLEHDFPHNFRMIKGDILNEKLLEDLFVENKISKVCHLAARAGVRHSIEMPKLYEETNIRGTLNLLEISRKHDIEKFVYASSSSVYGECAEVPFSEKMKLRPVSPYAATKLCNENDAYVYSTLFGLPTVGLRFFTAYGPSGRPDMAPFLFTKWIEEGIPLKRFGDGTTSRDYTYIDDIVQGVTAALDCDALCEVFNLGNSKTITLNEFIALLEKILGKKAVIDEYPRQPGDVRRTFADISHAKAKLGYAPSVDIEDGMRRFVQWYREQKKALEL